MSLVVDVKEALHRSQDVENSVAKNEELREAARLADLFDEIKPQPYIVPIERFMGIPVPERDRLDRKELWSTPY